MSSLRFAAAQHGKLKVTRLVLEASALQAFAHCSVHGSLKRCEQQPTARAVGCCSQLSGDQGWQGKCHEYVLHISRHDKEIAKSDAVDRQFPAKSDAVDRQFPVAASHIMQTWSTQPCRDPQRPFLLEFACVLSIATTKPNHNPANTKPLKPVRPRNTYMHYMHQNLNPKLCTA